MIADRGGTQDVQTSFMGLKKTDKKAKNKDANNEHAGKNAPNTKTREKKKRNKEK